MMSSPTTLPFLNIPSMLTAYLPRSRPIEFGRTGSQTLFSSEREILCLKKMHLNTRILRSIMKTDSGRTSISVRNENEKESWFASREGRYEVPTGQVCESHFDQYSGGDW